MSLLVLGINHKTASVGLREKVAFSLEQLQDALVQLKTERIVQNAVIVSTCNRTEIYCETIKESPEPLISWFCDFHQLTNDKLETSLYCHQDEAAISHLMRVACGLDSLVLGEPQILGQVKQSYNISVEHNAINGTLERLFHCVFSVAKRVRTETDIGGNAVSVAFAACSLARQIFESLASSTALLIGAGETIELVVKHLVEHQCSNIIIANRTRERAMKLAEGIGAKSISLEDIPEHMHHADIVISSTAAPLPIIGKGMVEQALKKRHYQPMLLIDIAVPRDIEKEVDELSDAYLYSVDDLHSIVERNREQRKLAAIQAEKIIDEECESFMNWIRSRTAVESIKQYRAQSEALKDALVTKSLQSLENGVDPRQVVAELSNKLTNKLIHPPTQAMQAAASEGDEPLLGRLRQMLGLDRPK